jgi:hypothetical protein
MSFAEKSNLVMVGVMAVVYGNYFARVLPSGFAGELSSLEEVQTLLLVTIGFLIAFSIIGHTVIAIIAPSDSDAEDERDKSITRRAQSTGVTILTIGCLIALGAALMGHESFWLVQIILAALVVTDICIGLIKAWLYRFGV